MARNKKQLPLLEKVTITDVAAEGKAIARVNDMVVFVPFVAPGDVIFILGRIDISIGQPGKGRTTMRIVKIFYTEVFYDIFLYLSLRHKLKN